jgi:hypothetical protein
MPPFFKIDHGCDGMGWIATRNIPNGMDILDETMFHKVFKRSSPSRGSTRKTKQKGPIDCFGLYGRDPSEKLYMNGMRLIDDINAYPLGKKRSNVGIYLQYSRLNHSCRPNAAAAIGPDKSSSGCTPIETTNGGA